MFVSSPQCIYMIFIYPQSLTTYFIINHLCECLQVMFDLHMAFVSLNV